MSDEDIALDEKRVFEERRGPSFVFVASDIGLARVAVSDDQIGRFGLVWRGETVDVAVDADGTVALATDEDVLLATPGAGEESDGDLAFEPTSFGQAVAVGFADGVVAANGQGRIARLAADGVWSTVGQVDSAVAGIDGPLVATDGGVFRIERTDLTALGASGVRDVAAVERLAATGDGVLYGAEGWRRLVEGDATAVASDGTRTLALVDGDLLERSGDEWRPAGCPRGDVVAIAVNDAAHAITADGTLLVDAPTAKDGAGGWAERSLGLVDVVAMAVLPAVR